MQSDVRDILQELKQSTSGTDVMSYEDQVVDGDFWAVNQCIPYILVDIKDPGDKVHEVDARMQGANAPFYAWYRCGEIKSIGIETVQGHEEGTTAIRFKFVEAENEHDLLNALVTPFFRRDIRLDA